MAAATRRAARLKAVEAIQRRRESAGPARGGQLRRRRRAGLCRRRFVGEVHASRRRRGAGNPRADHRRPARRRRLVRARVLGAGRDSAAVAARARDRERPGVHGSRQGRVRVDRRTLLGARGSGRVEDTPSRRAIFVCHPARADEEHGCATKILARIARLAYRRPVTAADTKTLIEFFDTGRKDAGTFDGGIQFALERLLVDPDFLLRVYRSTGRLSDLEIASRLSFFLWSSIPTIGCRARRAW